MEINFTKSRLTNNLRRLFIGTTTPVDKFPSFSNVSCILADKDDYINTLCVKKVEALMQDDNSNVLRALIKLMSTYSIAKVESLKVVMGLDDRKSYVPVKVTMVMENVSIKEGAINAQFKNVSVNIAKHDKCLATKYFNQALYHTNWYPIEVQILGNVWRYIDISTNLWHRRCEVLDQFKEYMTCKTNGLPLPPSNRAAFVVLEPYSTLGDPDYKSEGCNDIRVTNFGYNYESAKEIYKGLLDNSLAIIREDTLKDPLDVSEPLSVFTCIKVGIIKRNTSIPNGYADTEACETPLSDCLIYHMNEIRSIGNVDLSYGYGIKVGGIEIDPSVIHPYTEAKIRVKLEEDFAAVLNYHVTVVDPCTAGLQIDPSMSVSFDIPNSGCDCNDFSTGGVIIRPNEPKPQLPNPDDEVCNHEFATRDDIDALFPELDGQE